MQVFYSLYHLSDSKGYLRDLGSPQQRAERPKVPTMTREGRGPGIHVSRSPSKSGDLKSCHREKGCSQFPNGSPMPILCLALGGLRSVLTGTGHLCQMTGIMTTAVSTGSLLTRSPFLHCKGMEVRHTCPSSQTSHPVSLLPDSLRTYG